MTGEEKDMSEHEERVLHLVGEDPRYRGENQKQFRREDGMRERSLPERGELAGSGAGDGARRGKDGIPDA